MGWIRHHYIMVTHYGLEEIKLAHEKAKEMFNLSKEFGKEINLVSEILESVTNQYYTFLVAPDGSKEGWETSDLYDAIRKSFIQYLDETDIQFIEVAFDSDNDMSNVETQSDGLIAKTRLRSDL